MDGQDRGTKQVGVFSSLFSFKGGYLREAAKKSYFLNGSEIKRADFYSIG